MIRPIVVAGLLSLILVSGFGCSSPIPNRDPLGERFPDVVGRDLQERSRSLPAEHKGAPVLYLVGTVQETQFDIDRWLIGLLQLETPIRFLEVPTIPGLFPELFLQGTIDNGMREGIPSEDWGGVVTLYADDAERVVDFLGTTVPRNARVLLLDGEGRVRWFHDRGFSPSVLFELDAAVKALPKPTSKAPPEPPQ